MAQRGRKSAAVSLAVLPMADPSEVESVSRPDPPECAKRVRAKKGTSGVGPTTAFGSCAL